MTNKWATHLAPIEKKYTMTDLINLTGTVPSHVIPKFDALARIKELKPYE